MQPRSQGLSTPHPSLPSLTFVNQDSRIASKKSIWGGGGWPPPPHKKNDSRVRRNYPKILKAKWQYVWKYWRLQKSLTRKKSCTKESLTALPKIAYVPPLNCSRRSYPLANFDYVVDLSKVCLLIANCFSFCAPRWKYWTKYFALPKKWS